MLVSEGSSIQGLHHTAYRCADAEQTRQFYEDFLGLPLVDAFEINQTITNDTTEVSQPHPHPTLARSLPAGRLLTAALRSAGVAGGGGAPHLLRDGGRQLHRLLPGA